MINLVKAELSYMKTELIISKAAFILIGLLFLVFIVNPIVQAIVRGEGKGFYDAQYMFIIISIILCILPVAYIVMQLELLIREQSEKRVRMQSLLPLAINKISFTRLLVPLILLIGFLLVAVILLIIYSKICNSGLVSSTVSLNPEDLWFFVYFILITYWYRLFSERFGGILGILFCVLLIIKIAFTELLTPDSFREFFFQPIGILAISVTFCLIIHALFITRRSFLK